MEKAEILEMTVAYVSQLHGARCRSPSSDVTTRALRRKSHMKARNDLTEFDPSSSSEYRAGFSECLSHVRRFLADQMAATSREMSSEVALPQLLINHLSQFDTRAPPIDYERVSVRSTPPSPDTTLGALPSSDPSTSPSVKVPRHSFPRSSALSAPQSPLSVGRHALPPFLLPFSSALRRDELSGDGVKIEYETQHRLGRTVIVAPSQPPSSTPFSLASPSISMSACSSPQRQHAAATCLQHASPGNAVSDVWRPWKPETNACFQCSGVRDSSSAL